MARTRSRSTRTLLPLLALATAVLAGCDASSPTSIEGGSQNFAGEIAADGSAEHFFAITGSGGVQLTVLEVAFEPARDDETFTPFLGLALGVPDDEGGCMLTFQATILTDSRLAFSLDQQDYCLRIFDSGAMLDEEIGRYGLTLEPSAD